MTKNRIVTLLLALFVLTAGTASAQIDNFGQTDTIYIETAPIDDHTWVIHVLFTNDEYIDALTVPLKMSAGETRIIGDSAVYTGGRVEHFDLKGFRADTAIQCVTMGLMGSMSQEEKALSPGKGRLVTVFVSSVDDVPFDELTVDTTITHPSNSLMAVAQRTQPGEEQITVEEFENCRIIPALVITRSEQ